MGKMQKDMCDLSERVDLLTQENRELRAWVRVLQQKTRLNKDDQGEDELWRTIENQVDKGSPTPVGQNPINLNQWDPEDMEVEEEEGMKWEEDAQNMDEELRNKNRKNIPHKSYLEECFRKQKGRTTEKPQRCDIYNFTNKRIAKGYQRILTACQGMYYEISDEQIDWTHWNDKRSTVCGDWCWRAGGVSLY